MKPIDLVVAQIAPRIFTSLPLIFCSLILHLFLQRNIESQLCARINNYATQLNNINKNSGASEARRSQCLRNWWAIGKKGRITKRILLYLGSFLNKELFMPKCIVPFHWAFWHNLLFGLRLCLVSLQLKTAGISVWGPHLALRKIACSGLSVIRKNYRSLSFSPTLSFSKGI